MLAELLWAMFIVEYNFPVNVSDHAMQLLKMLNWFDIRAVAGTAYRFWKDWAGAILSFGSGAFPKGINTK